LDLVLGPRLDDHRVPVLLGSNQRSGLKDVVQRLACGEALSAAPGLRKTATLLRRALPPPVR
jgi:hypothetical protein